MCVFLEIWHVIGYLLIHLQQPDGGPLKDHAELFKYLMGMFEHFSMDVMNNNAAVGNVFLQQSSRLTPTNFFSFKMLYINQTKDIALVIRALVGAYGGN